MTGLDSRARAAVRGLAAYKPGKPIEDVKRQYKLASVIKLASNENALGPSPKAILAMRKIATHLNRYPDGACRELKARLGKHVHQQPGSLIVGNGSDELITLALRAFIDPGDEVVVASPTFLIYEIQAKACGAKVNVVPLRQYRYDLPAMKAAITPHTKLVFIANPDNPTGSYVTKKELDVFVRGLPHQTIVFMDEAYHEFVEVSDYPRTLAMVHDVPMIVTRSFSKAYGLAGLRVGYGIAQPSIISAMDAVREPFNVNSMAQAAAAAALDDTAFLRRTRELAREGRRYLVRELHQLKVRCIPSVANFLLIELGPKAADVADGLLRRGVIVREMSAWKLAGCLRVTVGTMPENRRFIQALKQCVR